ncbi:hypothetical protein [Paenibacillus sp. IITD108]|uniref:hypothetical protein n=1 Tax=Paenibacillus sp. IITD108 TaxID=3116649 RepID=UPI002F3F326A
MKIKVNALFFLSLLIAAAGFTMFLLLFIKGEELLPKEYVFTPKSNLIDTYTDITSENFKELFELQEVLKASVTPNMVTVDKMDAVMNKSFVSPLHKGEYLTTFHVADPILVPDDGEMPYPIPNDWWAVIDWTGRIGDVGEIWLTPTESLRKWYEQQEQSSKLLDSINGTEIAKITEYIVVPDKENRPLSKPIFENVRVRYVFDSSNRQIRNAEEVDDRSEGTGRPENVKMFLTPEKFANLKLAVEEGYKLILAVDNGVVRK